MSRSTRTALATAGLLVLGAVPAAADAPVVGPQQTWHGAKAPVSVPGNHLHRGDRIPKGHVLVSREVTVSGGSGRRRVVLTLPAGRRLTGVALSEGSTAVRSILLTSHYIGHRRAVFVVYAHGTESGKATFYAYGG